MCKLKEVDQTLSAREKYEMRPRGGGDSIYMCKSCMKIVVSEAIKDGPLSFVIIMKTYISLIHV